MAGPWLASAGQLGGRSRVVVHAQGRGDPQGQRQAAAQRHDIRDGRVIAVALQHDAGLADGRAEQLCRAVVAQRLQRRHMMRPAHAGQPLARRDQGGAAGTRRKQVIHLVGVGRVIEHDQHAAVRQQGPVLGEALVPALGHRGHAKGAQELRENLAGVGAGPRRTAQLGEKLPVGKPVRRLMRGAHRQGRLADAAGAGDDDGRRGGARAGQQRGDLPRQVAAPDHRLGAGQLARHRGWWACRQAGSPGDRELRGRQRHVVGPGDGEVQVSQQAVRLGAGFLGQRLGMPVIRRGGIGRVTAAAGGDHEQLAQPAVAGVEAGDLDQLIEDALVVRRGDLQLEQPGRRALVPLLQARDLPAERAARHVGQRPRPPPQQQRLAQGGDLLRRAPAGARLLRQADQVLENQQVSVPRRDPQLVAEPGVGPQILAAAEPGQHLAHGHDPLVQLRFLDLRAAPGGADQGHLGKAPVGVQQQRGQDDQRGAARQLRRIAFWAYLKLAQEPVDHRAPPAFRPVLG